MYPQLISQASRLAPVLSRLMSRGAAGAFSAPGRLMQLDTPDVSPVQPMTPQAPTGPSPPISTDNSAPPRSYPWADAMAGHDQTGNYPPAGDPMTAAPYVTQLPRSSPPSNPSSVPMPQARPETAPQPDTSFFMRNAMMMQDPNGGGFIDPTGASSVRGPDLIQKMMGYLNNKV